MFCPHCNHFIEYETDRCPYCYNTIQNQGAQYPLPMRWYRFLITVWLRIEVAWNVVAAIIRLMLLFSPDTSSYLGYYNYGFALNVVAMITDIVFAYWGYKIRILLSDFRSGAGNLYIRYLIVSHAFSVASSFLIGQFIIPLAIALVDIFCNKAYFSKREHLFVH